MCAVVGYVVKFIVTVTSINAVTIVLFFTVFVAIKLVALFVLVRLIAPISLVPV